MIQGLHRYAARSARLLGIAPDEYTARHAAGFKRCVRCREWHARGEFGSDRATWDGLNASCRQSYRVKVKRSSGHSANLGRKLSAATRFKMSAARSGEKNPRWKGGITKVTRRARQNAIYQQWRRIVLKRDERTCQECHTVPRYPHVHHILSFKSHPELKLKVWNGVTLCAECHRAVHKKDGSYGK